MTGLLKQLPIVTGSPRRKSLEGVMLDFHATVDKGCVLGDRLACTNVSSWSYSIPYIHLYSPSH